MSIILSIETSSELASAALYINGVLNFAQVQGVSTHSQSLLPMVQSLLRDSGIRLGDCDAIAFGSGPGSFTGVRTACGVAQGLGYGAGIPLVPIVTLLALAQACREKNGATDVLCVMDARMGEVYWAQYRYDEVWQTIVAPTLSSAADVRPVGQVTACGNGLKAYAADFASCSFIDSALSDLLPHAAAMARLGATDFALGRAIAAADAEPLYLRNKVALTSSERLAKALGEAA